MSKPDQIKRVEDIELVIPKRMLMEPKPGDNPLRRPYPEYAKDMKVITTLISKLPTGDMGYNVPPSDRRVPIQPHGVLFFHALDIQKLVLSKKNFIRGQPFCVYVEIECQDTVKCSDPVYSIGCEKVMIDHSIHMLIECSEFRWNDRNDFIIHVYAFQDPSTHYLVGSAVTHMYEYIREVHGITSIKLVNELSFIVGKLNFEYSWTYGSFGYGFSAQLYNTKHDVFENVSHSLFPRIRVSPDDLVDNKFNVRIPKKHRLVNLHNVLVRKVKKKKGQKETEKPERHAGRLSLQDELGAEWEAKPVIYKRVKFCRGSPVYAHLNQRIQQKFMEDEFNMIWGEYVCLRNRRDRLHWLTQLIDGRLKDKMEHDGITELFLPFHNVAEARRILSLKRPPSCPPSYMENTSPFRIKHCRPIHINPHVEEEDRDFVKEHLGGAPRFSGYLNFVFGYATPPPKEEGMEGFEYELPKRASKELGQVIKEEKTWQQRTWLNLGASYLRLKNCFVSFYRFFCPSYDRHYDPASLPEISLTMPSPQHSTTDFHSFCTQKQLYVKETDLKETQRVVTRYIAFARKNRNADVEHAIREDYPFELIVEGKEKDAIVIEVTEDKGGGGDDAEVGTSASVHKVNEGGDPVLSHVEESKTEVGASASSHTLKEGDGPELIHVEETKLP